MEKEFIPYTEALALKELGFDEPCFGYYNSNGKFKTKQDEYELYLICNSKWISPSCSAPTWQSAFRWFREKYGLLVNIEKGTNPENYFPVIGNVSHRYNPNLWFDTYEEAELACLGKLVENAESKIEL
jgi:hypothetical protein